VKDPTEVIQQYRWEVPIPSWTNDCYNDQQANPILGWILHIQQKIGERWDQCALDSAGTESKCIFTDFTGVQARYVCTCFLYYYCIHFVMNFIIYDQICVTLLCVSHCVRNCYHV